MVLEIIVIEVMVIEVRNTSWKGLRPGIHPQVQVGRTRSISAGTSFLKGKHKPSACMNDHLFPSYRKQVSKQNYADLQTRTFFFPSADCTNNQTLFFSSIPRVKINRNI